MELRSLRYFVAVAEELHFGRAAQRLFITQPGLSQGVKALEREMGVCLFERSRQRVQLSAQGAELLPRARALLAEAAGLSELAASLAGRRGCSLAVAHASCASPGLAARMVSCFRRAHPDVAVATSSGDTAENVRALRAGEVDVAFVRPPLECTDGLLLLQLAEDPVVLVVPEAHRLGGRGVVGAHELCGEPLVVLPPSSDGLGRAVSQAVFAGGCPPVRHTEPDEAHLLAAVAEGEGITLVTGSAASVLDVPGVRVVDLEGAPVVTLALAWRDGDDDPALLRFVRLARESTAAVRPHAGRGASRTSSGVLSERGSEERRRTTRTEKASGASVSTS